MKILDLIAAPFKYLTRESDNETWNRSYENNVNIHAPEPPKVVRTIGKPTNSLICSGLYTGQIGLITGYRFSTGIYESID